MAAKRRMTPARKTAKRGAAKSKKARKAAKPGKHRAPYYLSCVSRSRTVSIWIVNGSLIRRDVDEEFTNFGHHWSVSAIPKDEIWLDQETHPDEQRFYVAHATIERRLMARGTDYDTARAAGSLAERRLRAKSGDIQRVAPGNSLPQAARVHLRIWKVLTNGVQVWFVNGRLVRSVFDIDFTEGGHDHVYEFVPKNEIWIDDDCHEDENSFVLFHEMHERNLMEKGMDYDTAHDDSSRLEKHYRLHPDQLHAALAAEGWE
jgi:hypothetical protein